MLDEKSVAFTVLLRGLQSWGQSIEERIKAWQGAYDFMGLSVKIDVGVEDGRKVFVFNGADAESAKLFMNEVKENFSMSKFQDEEFMIMRCLEKYKKSKLSFFVCCLCGERFPIGLRSAHEIRCRVSSGC